MVLPELLELPEPLDEPLSLPVLVSSQSVPHPLVVLLVKSSLDNVHPAVPSLHGSESLLDSVSERVQPAVPDWQGSPVVEFDNDDADSEVSNVHPASPDSHGSVFAPSPESSEPHPNSVITEAKTNNLPSIAVEPTSHPRTRYSSLHFAKNGATALGTNRRICSNTELLEVQYNVFGLVRTQREGTRHGAILRA